MYRAWGTSFLPKDGHKNKSQPPVLIECGGHLKTTDLYHHQKGSRDAAEIAHMVDVSPSGEIGETFQVHLVADRRNFVAVDEVFAFRRITSNPNCCFSTHCTSSTDEVSSVSDMYTVP